MNPWYWRERASADLKTLSRDEDGNTSSGSGGGLGGCSSLWIAPSSHMLLCGPSLMSVVCAVPRTSAISPMMCIDGSSEPGCFRDISSVCIFSSISFGRSPGCKIFEMDLSFFFFLLFRILGLFWVFFEVLVSTDSR